MTMFESTQYAQVYYNELEHELAFTLILKCVERSRPEIAADLNQPGEPGEAPEFELVQVPTFGICISDVLSKYLFRSIVGPEIAKELYENAIQEAIESGDF